MRGILAFLFLRVSILWLPSSSQIAAHVTYRVSFPELLFVYGIANFVSSISLKFAV